MLVPENGPGLVTEVSIYEPNLSNSAVWALGEKSSIRIEKTLNNSVNSHFSAKGIAMHDVCTITDPKRVTDLFADIISLSARGYLVDNVVTSSLSGLFIACTLISYEGHYI
jgi:putative N-acetylmannosamine-6-phosphate epimerase